MAPIKQLILILLKLSFLIEKTVPLKPLFSRLGAEPFNLVFHAVDDKKTSYETQKKAPNKSFYHIENQDGNLALYEIDEQTHYKIGSRYGTKRETTEV